MTIKKFLKRTTKLKGPRLEVRNLAKKLGVKGNIDISTKKSWFSDAMDNLEKEKKCD